MDYIVINDKRKTLNCSLFLICCLVYAILEIFVFSKFEIQDKTWSTIWTIFQCLLGISPFVLFEIIKCIFNKPFMLLCGIKNLTGIYIGEIVSVNGNKKTRIPAQIEIIHKLDKLSICFSTEQSSSFAKNITLDINNNESILLYNYENTGDPINEKNKMHIGTCEIRIRNEILSGSYFNNGRDRKTYGSINLKKTTK